MRATERSEALSEAHKEAIHMYDYMKALHLRFYREPECAQLRQEIDEARETLRARLGREDKRTLLHLTDGLSLLREETALESFVSGFQLAWGMAREMEARGLYSFDVEESQRVHEAMEQEM